MTRPITWLACAVLAASAAAGATLAVGQEAPSGPRKADKPAPPRPEKAGKPATVPGLAEIAVDAWTCADHAKFRMTGKGKCPVCSKELTRTKVTVQGAADLSDPYPLETCPVSGRKLEVGTQVVMMHENREVRFCGPGCIGKFEADAKKYLEQVDAKIIESQAAAYPMGTCPVSGESLDSRGGAVDMVFANRLVRFCCNGCIRKFRSDPAAYLAKLDASVRETQLQGYPMANCPVSAQKLGSMGEPVDYVAANRLVRFCCDDCVGAFQKEPAKYLAQLDQAWKGRGQKKGQDEHGHDRDGHDH